MEIRRGNKKEFNTIIDFINFVFSSNKGGCPHDFLNLYANLYHETDESMHNLINMWDEDLIVGSVLAFPRTLSVGGRELSVCGIGSVACHPRYRGQGIMSKLLEYSNAEMEKNGVQLSNLGGRRSRYNHFGYENAGNCYRISLSTIAFKASGYKAKGYSFVPFTLEDTDIVGKMHELYKSKPIHYVYSEEQFFLRLIIPASELAIPYAVYNEKSELLGYIAIDKYSDDCELREICLFDDSLTSEVIMEFVALNMLSISTCFYEYQMDDFAPIASIGSLVKHVDSGMWAILDFKSVISALLSFKASYSTLPEGSLVLALGDETLKVTLHGGEVSVIDSTDCPDFSFGKLEAISALTAPVTSSYFRKHSNPDKLGLALRWFPLPLACLSGERV